MPEKAGKASTMRGVGIVKARILSFDTVKGAVKVGCFDSNFGNEVKRKIK